MPVLKQTNFFLELFAVTVENVYTAAEGGKRTRWEELGHNYHLIIHIARYDLLL